MAKQYEKLLATFMHEHRDKAVKLLMLNGVRIQSSMTPEQVDIAFLKAIKDNDNFRSQVSQMLYEMQYHTFVDNSKYLNAVTDPEPWLGGSTTTTGSTATTTPKKSFLGSIFTPELIQSGIKTGLDSLSTSQQAKANAQSEANALELERIRLAQIQAENEKSKLNPNNLSTGAKLGIGLGVAAVAGIIIYMVMKAKKK